MTLDLEVQESLRNQLLERRHALVRMSRGAVRALEELEGDEPPAELEEDAQSTSAAFVLAQLSAAQRHEVAQIDAALSRMDAGTYGECIDCGEMIPIERLRVLPSALRDATCAARAENRSYGYPHEYPTL